MDIVNLLTFMTLFALQFNTCVLFNKITTFDHWVPLPPTPSPIQISRVLITYKLKITILIDKNKLILGIQH